jgi:hypothetical protein
MRRTCSRGASMARCRVNHEQARWQDVNADRRPNARPDIALRCDVWKLVGRLGYPGRARIAQGRLGRISKRNRQKIGQKQPVYSPKNDGFMSQKSEKRGLISTHNVAFRYTAFDHREAVPAVVVLDLVHYVVNEQNAAAAGLK